MPIIPRIQEQAQMNPSSPVPVRGAASAGVASASEADVGGAIAKFGQVVMQHYEKQQDMAQSNSYELAATRVEAAYSTAYDQAKKQSAPDGSDFVQKFNDISTPMVEEAKKGGPTQGAYVDKLNTTQEVMRTKIQARAIVEGASMLEQHNADGAIKIGDAFADSVTQNPTADMVASRKQSYGSYLDDKVTKGIFDPKTREKLERTFDEKLGLSYIQGLAIKGSYGQAVNALKANQQDPSFTTKLNPDDAKAAGLIDSTEAQELKSKGQTYDIPTLTKSDGAKLTPELSAALGAIDPVRKGNLIMQLKNKAEGESALRVSELNANVSGLEQLAYHGGDISNQQIAMVKQQINMNAALTPFARVRLMDQVNTAAAANGVIKALEVAPRSQWSGIVDSFDKRVDEAHATAVQGDARMAGASSDIAVQANRQVARNRLDQYVAKLAKIQSDDAGLFSIQSDNRMSLLYQGTKDGSPGGSQKFAQQTLANQERLQIPADDRSILPNSEATSLGTVLSNLPNSEATNDFVSGLQQKWGSYYPQVMNEISATDKSLKKYQALTYAPASTRGQLVDAIRNQDTIKSTFSQLDQKTVEQGNINTAVNAKLGEFSSAVTGSSNDISRIGVVTNFRDAMELQVKRDYIKDPRGFNVNESTNRAYNDLVGAQFNIAKGPQGSVIVPKAIAGQPMLAKPVEDFLNYHSDAAGMKELNPFIPKDPLGKYQRDPESFYSDLAARGKWVTSPAQDGVRLMNTEMDGRLTPIFDKFGKPIEKKYLDMSLHPISNDQKVKRQMRQNAPGAPSGG